MMFFIIIIIYFFFLNNTFIQKGHWKKKNIFQIISILNKCCSFSCLFFKKIHWFYNYFYLFIYVYFIFIFLNDNVALKTGVMFSEAFPSQE